MRRWTSRGAGLAQHLGELLLRGAADDRVVDDDEPLAGDVLAQRVELHAHRPGAELLARGDEAAADVAVLHHALAERDAAAPGEALGRGHAGLGHAHHHVGLDGRLLGELLADADAGLVDALVVEAGVGPGEVDELEQAELAGRSARPGTGCSERGPSASMTTISPGSSSRTKWAPTMSRAGLSDASTQPVVELAEAQRAEAVRVAHADHAGLVHEHEGEGALEPGQHLGERPLEVAVVARLLGQVRRARCRSARRRGRCRW